MIMNKKEEEAHINVNAALTTTVGTIFEKMSERLHYKKNRFTLIGISKAGEHTQSVTVAHEGLTLRVPVPEKESLEDSFERGLEKELRKYDKYKDRFEVK